jgi:alanine racemase
LKKACKGYGKKYQLSFFKTYCQYFSHSPAPRFAAGYGTAGYWFVWRGWKCSMQQQLKNVSTLKTTISQIKKVKAGESIGYSRKGIAEKDAVIATVRIGYADGYPRSLSNGQGKMW